MGDPLGFEESDVIALEAGLPKLRGAPGLTQGAYGERGNLELVVPDADDGLWVFWFNNDHSIGNLGAQPGGWSGGLRFACGTRYDGAAIVQSRHGPNWLEVVAVGVGVARRYTWRPESGFSETGQPWHAVGTPSAIETDDGILHVATNSSADGIELRTSRGSIYQQSVSGNVQGLALLLDGRLVWSDDDGFHRGTEIGGAARQKLASAGDDVAWIEDGRVVLERGPDLALVGAALSFALATSRTDRDRLEVVVRGEGGLWHARLDLESRSWLTVEPIVSRVLIPPGPPVVHRY